jgi:hypothetical protein
MSDQIQNSLEVSFADVDTLVQQAQSAAIQLASETDVSSVMTLLGTIQGRLVRAEGGDYSPSANA